MRGVQDNHTPPTGDSGKPRPVRTYVRRSGRITESQKRDYDALASRWCVPARDGRPLNFPEMFGNDNPVVIEIGFGRGNATAQIAAGNPGVNYLGIEVFTGGVGHLLGEIRRLGLANLRIIEGDALELLAGRVPDGSVAGFHLFFPDPWPKKRHHKRRLLRRPRTDLLAAKLTPGGGICFVTDIADYALSARAELDATPGLANRFPGFAPRQTWRPETRFEAKGTAQGREPLELVYEKRPESACIPTG